VQYRLEGESVDNSEVRRGVHRTVVFSHINDRPDVVVQSIVDLVLPELAREDALEEFNFLTKHGLPVPPLVLDRAGLAHEATASTKQAANGGGGPSGAGGGGGGGGGGNAGGDAAQSSSASRPVYQDNVTFYLMPATMGVAEPLPPLDKNVLRTTAAVTVQALQKFVVKKLKLTISSKDVRGMLCACALRAADRGSQVSLMYRETVLGREQTMRWVLRTVAFEDPIPTIFYKLNKSAQQQ